MRKTEYSPCDRLESCNRSVQTIDCSLLEEGEHLCNLFDARFRSPSTLRPGRTSQEMTDSIGYGWSRLSDLVRRGGENGALCF